MTSDSRHRITPAHLERTAYVYVRQSTLHQVRENRESQERQYALRDRAVALGWPSEKVVVIDEDQGHSGATTSGRLGFQRLAGEVGMGRVGAVMGLEVSRLARDDADWAQLVKICSMTKTLMIDEDGVYDPCEFNDWMLLGFKGMMSGAELHILRARLQGGLLNKARRGELRTRLPVGFRYREDGKVVLDPDPQVQTTLRHFFHLFEQTRSARKVVKCFRTEGCRFPRRIWSGTRAGELVWGSLDHARALEILHNPRYAGAFFYGRRQSRWKVSGGRESTLQPLENWYALVRGVHPGYVNWERYETNLALLRENAVAHGRDRRRSPPREGPALLHLTSPLEGDFSSRIV
ncbi:MAG: recombinase family protein [Thermoplasmata archaeon]